ncbi:pimeloyl-ACP methyl ester esterase BioH [Sedimenticola selenatireducens]|uniref:pimeloyl-ACP methyl ester esterase BioH n=1 Tax=Sedimenticola selenatireducens TaxID=191960 RepID=UPI002AAA8854|nr:pimeloyl-ACP methyl ester esterase BioH [Sedimenticola selenatireducens]
MRLFVETTGDGPELVLLHGWGMNAAVWSPVVAELSQAFRVTVIELPGHGASAYDPAASTLDDWVTACLAAAPERAVWIGWSLGGQLAQRAALRDPQRISGLVMVTASPRFVVGDGWPHAMALATLTQFARALRRDHHQTLERFLSLQVQGDEAARETLRLLRQDIALRPEADPLALEHGLELLRTVDLRAGLGDIRCPTLWLFGERDTLVPADLCDELERLMPAAEILILQGCAHAPFLSHPRQCLRALNHFLEPDHA